jgi:hypothetical protein
VTPRGFVALLDLLLCRLTLFPIAAYYFDLLFAISHCTAALQLSFT